MSDAPTIVAATSAEKRLVWMVRDLVAQSCTDRSKDDSTSWEGPVPVFSQFVGKFAEAIALLHDYGLVTEFTDNGGRVVSGKLLSLVDTAEKLQTGFFDSRHEETLETKAGEIV